MLHAAFVRSPVAHARIARIDVDSAVNAAGVVLVMTGKELEKLIVPGPSLAAMWLAAVGGDIPIPSFDVLTTDKVRFVGDPVALIVAENRYLAEDACEHVQVEYDALPPVVTPEAALAAAGPRIFADLRGNVLANWPVIHFGDVENAFARADRILRFQLSQHRHQNVPIECRGCACDFDPVSQELTVHASTQSVHIFQMGLVHQLGLPAEKVRVLADDVGGSFGLKNGPAREEIACAAASRQLERPVRWIEDRAENLTAATHARDESFDIEAAITDQGDILAFRVNMLIDTGAYPGIGGLVVSEVKNMLPGPYKLQALSFEATAVVTNKASYGSYRGPFAAETWVRERIIDLIAHELEMEPMDVRLRNVVERGVPPLETITGRSLAGVTSRESLERVRDLIDLEDFRTRQAVARTEGRYLGVGVATYIEPTPGPPAPDGSRSNFVPEEMRLRLETDGTLTVFTQQMPHGQGHKTTLAQVAADEFGVAFEKVNVVVGDSRQVPWGFGTGASRSAAMAGGACLHGARALRAKVLAVAAYLFRAAPDDMELSDGNVSVLGVPAVTMPVGEVARAALRTDLPEEMSGTFEVTTTFDGGQAGWSGATHAAIVEVDTDTGHVRFERYLVVQDCGVLINPAIVAGQIRGGVAQGIGAVLYERSAYDLETGQFLSGTLMDYLLPTAYEVPRVEIVYLETVPLDEHVNFRGVGEGGMIASPAAVGNAIEDALAPFGVRVTEQHLSPTRILELLGTIEPAAEYAVREFANKKGRG